jgi:translation initiation factor 1
MARLFEGTPFDIPPKCDRCGQREPDCTCTEAQKAEFEAERQRQAKLLPPEKQTARVSVQKRKGGRKATVVAGLADEANDLPALLADLQSRLGAGGTVKRDEDLIELQGDHRQRVQDALRDIGFRVKR